MEEGWSIFYILHLLYCPNETLGRRRQVFGKLWSKIYMKKQQRGKRVVTNGVDERKFPEGRNGIELMN
jgi:hypothetical protein